MCYHSKQKHKLSTVQHRFGATVTNPDEVGLIQSNHWNGFDYPRTPVITNESEDKIQFFNWGLIPQWADNPDIRQYTLNAKVETLDEKPSFKDHQTHRCLVIASGFYEWKWLDTKGRKKEKYDIGLSTGEPFAFAGIWSKWTDSATGKSISSYSVVTTEAQRMMRDIHNIKLRMPIILRPDQEKNWLSGDNKNNYIDTGIRLEGISENPQLGLF